MAETKLFLSARVTEKFFSSEEIKEIKQELQTCSKSKFIRKAIKTYLNADKEISPLPQESNLPPKEKLQTIKSLLKENQSLLMEIKNNNLETTDNTSQQNNNENPASSTYQGKKQEAKRDEALNLLNQF